MDATGPRRGEQVSYYAAVRLETGAVAVPELAGNCNAGTAADLLRQLRAPHREPLIVIWDNSPAHRGDAIRAYRTTPNRNRRWVNWPRSQPSPYRQCRFHLGFGLGRTFKPSVAPGRCENHGLRARDGDFLMQSELTETKACIRSFVKEIAIAPGQAIIRYTMPMPGDSPIGKKESEEIRIAEPVLTTAHNGWGYRIRTCDT